MSDLDLDAIRGRHTAGGFTRRRWCGFDHDLWPCDAIRLCDEVEKLRAENERLRGDASDLSFDVDEETRRDLGMSP